MSRTYLEIWYDKSCWGTNVAKVVADQNDDLENGVRKEKLKLMLINQHHFSWKLAIVYVHMVHLWFAHEMDPKEMFT